MKAVGLTLIAASLIVFFAGVFWGGPGAGIPYQDPTPRQRLEEIQRTAAATAVMQIAGAQFCSGIFIYAAGRFCERRSKNVEC